MKLCYFKVMQNMIINKTKIKYFFIFANYFRLISFNGIFFIQNNF